MTRARPDPTGGTAPLPFAVARRRPRRHEAAVNRAVLAARAAAGLEASDAAAVSLLRALGRALDVAEAEPNAWAVAAVSRELRETLAVMRLTPAARGHDGADPFAEWLAELTTAEHPENRPAD